MDVRNATLTGGVTVSATPGGVSVAPSVGLTPTANDTVLGNISGATAVPIGLTQTQFTSLVNVFTKTLSGAVPAPGSATPNGYVLTAAGTWVGVNTGANPTAQVGLVAVNGVLTTYMRSDAAPALSQAINPVWTGTHVFAGPFIEYRSSGATVATVTYFSQVGVGDVGIFGCDGSQNLFATSTNGDMVIGPYNNTNNLWFTNDGATNGLALLTDNSVTLGTAAGKGAGTINLPVAYYVNGVKQPIFAAGLAGWGTPAGPAVVANFPATPTLAQCGAAVGQIIATLKAAGVYLT
jgi:hypothetical protein